MTLHEEFLWQQNGGLLKKIYWLNHQKIILELKGYRIFGAMLQLNSKTYE